jgi:hypothetical protein
MELRTDATAAHQKKRKSLKEKKSPLSKALFL